MQWPDSRRGHRINRRNKAVLSWPFLFLGLFACATPREHSIRQELRRAEHRYESISPNKPSGDRFSQARKAPQLPPSTLESYIELALQQSPVMLAAYERWRASVYRIAKERRLPEPTVSVSYFVRSVHTRNGPQRTRLSARQAFPWPTQFRAKTDAAAMKAKAMHRAWQAHATSIARRVSIAHWTLWEIRATRAIHREHLTVLQSLSESARARVSTGAATLAELQQIDLAAARLEDQILGMKAAEQRAELRLSAAIGVPRPTLQALPTPKDPEATSIPEPNEATMRTWAQSHPRLEQFSELALASQSAAHAKNAERLPRLSVGLDWISIAKDPGMTHQTNGQDAWIIQAGMSIPLWQRNYSEATQAHESDARAYQYERQALLDQSLEALHATLSNLEDAKRRAQLYEQTLVPQAQATYQSVLGSFTVGRGSVAQALLAQQELLELRIELQKAKASHAIAWSRLQEVLGRPVPARVSPIPPPAP